MKDLDRVSCCSVFDRMGGIWNRWHWQLWYSLYALRNLCDRAEERTYWQCTERRDWRGWIGWWWGSNFQIFRPLFQPLLFLVFCVFVLLVILIMFCCRLLMLTLQWHQCSCLLYLSLRHNCHLGRSPSQEGWNVVLETQSQGERTLNTWPLPWVVTLLAWSQISLPVHRRKVNT